MFPNIEHLCNIQCLSDIEAVCNCRQAVIQKSTVTMILGIECFSQITSRHRQDCSLARTQKSTRISGLQYSHFSRWLRTAINASFRVQFGAGELSIIPHLSLRGCYSDDSPAFKLLCELGWSQAKTLSQYTSIMKQYPTRLLLLFTDGKASPNEKDELGETLFHVSHSTRNLVAQPLTSYYTDRTISLEP